MWRPRQYGLCDTAFRDTCPRQCLQRRQRTQRLPEQSLRSCDELTSDTCFGFFFFPFWLPESVLPATSSPEYKITDSVPVRKAQIPDVAVLKHEMERKTHAGCICFEQGNGQNNFLRAIRVEQPPLEKLEWHGRYGRSRGRSSSGYKLCVCPVQIRD